MTRRDTSPLWAVIMAGGAGTRFWPVSRKAKPKQFLPPGGGIPPQNAGPTLLDATLKRIRGLAPPERTLIMASAAHRKLLRNLDIPKRNVVHEPAGRNTAPCLGLAARLIEHGDADVMVAGGSEYGTSPITVAAFATMKALSTRNDDPEAASRPWDRDRDGFVLGEGAGVVVLEEYERARRRGADIYAELLGFGMSGDAHHITSPLETGAGGIACMENALRDAGLAPESVDYINAHGTSTPLGDVAETKMIKHVFGQDTGIAISSTKSMTGHLLGAAGSVEAIFTIMAIRDQVCPPTINLENPGEECDLDYVPNQAREMPVQVGLSNSFGFGGTNGTVIFGAV